MYRREKQAERAIPLVRELAAGGMTMVIATGGVDLSVGAVIAISAAMGAVLINPALGNQLISNEVLTDVLNKAIRKSQELAAKELMNVSGGVGGLMGGGQS